MKSRTKKILASLFLIALVAAPLTGCGEKGNNGGKDSVQGVIVNENLRVTLGRTIYLVGEPLEVVSVERYSDYTGTFTPQPNFRYDFDFSKTAGEKNVKITVGTQEVTVAVKVYETAEAAAAANSIFGTQAENEKLFKESEVINFNTMKLKKETVEGVDSQNNFILRSAAGTKGITSLNKVGTGMTDVWTNDESNQNFSVLDSTRKSTPHTRTNQTTGKKYLYGAYDAQQWKTEMIFDGEGRLAYFASCMPDNTWKYSGHIHTQKWYSHPVYENVFDNPALVIEQNIDNLNALAEDNWELVNITEDNAWEATDDFPSTYVYEKVIPEGGFYVILGNAIADDIWQWFTGGTELTVDDDKPDDADHSLIFQMSNREKFPGLNESRAFFDYSTSKIKFYTPSTPKQQYGYYYLKAYNGKQADEAKYTEAFNFKDEVYKAIIESNNPLIATEKVLADYYNGHAQKLIDQWADMLAALEA